MHNRVAVLWEYPSGLRLVSKKVVSVGDLGKDDSGNGILRFIQAPELSR